MKERVQYLTDTFTDYEGVERNFTICAVTIYDNYNYNPITSFGISVCKKEDISKYSSELGQRIAYGKAMKNPFADVICNMKGGMNTEICKAYLNTFAKYFKEDPSIAIAGYKKVNDPKNKGKSLKQNVQNL